MARHNTAHMSRHAAWEEEGCIGHNRISTAEETGREEAHTPHRKPKGPGFRCCSGDGGFIIKARNRGVARSRTQKRAKPRSGASLVLVHLRTALEAGFAVLGTKKNNGGRCRSRRPNGPVWPQQAAPMGAAWGAVLTPAFTATRASATTGKTAAASTRRAGLRLVLQHMRRPGHRYGHRLGHRLGHRHGNLFATQFPTAGDTDTDEGDLSEITRCLLQWADHPLLASCDHQLQSSVHSPCLARIRRRRPCPPHG